MSFVGTFLELKIKLWCTKAELFNSVIVLFHKAENAVVARWSLPTLGDTTVYN